MSDYPINSTAKVYKDSDGNDVTLRQLIKLDPEWAHTRIKEAERYERAIAIYCREYYDAEFKSDQHAINTFVELMEAFE